MRDILETEVDDNLDKMTSKEGKAHCLTASYTGAVPWNSIEKSLFCQKSPKLGHFFTQKRAKLLSHTLSGVPLFWPPRGTGDQGKVENQILNFPKILKSVYLKKK